MRAGNLLLGNSPGGSDDSPPLNVVDPALARDSRPDLRRHSRNKFVPDLVASNEQTMFVIEMKPSYSANDEQK